MEFLIRVLNDSDFDALCSLHRTVLSNLPHPEALRVDSADFLKANLNVRGKTFGAFHNQRMVAYAVVAFPAIGDPGNLGPDLGITPDEFQCIAVYDGSGVHPEFRGHRLHTLLNQFRLREAIRRGALHVTGTVSPNNPYSLHNHLSAGLLARGIRRKYNGMLRILVHQDLRNPSPSLAADGMLARMTDEDALAKAFSDGYVGHAVVRGTDNATCIRLAQLLCSVAEQ